MSATQLRNLVEFCRAYDLVQTRVGLENALAVSFSKNRIIVYEVANEILGYVESWRITYEQFGRLLCREPFLLDIEDIERGNICYLANIAIRPDYRNSQVTDVLHRKFLEQNQDAEYFVGEALRKRHQPVKVFKNKHMKEVIHHG